jgi:hypothetical protein
LDGWVAEHEIRTEVITVGTAINTDSLVGHAIDLLSRAERDGALSGDVCVLDRDSFPESNFALGFELARVNRLNIAWFSKAFELWYLLHFNCHDTAIPRHTYAERIPPFSL